MIILQETANPQTISFIPRQDAWNTITITDEQKGTTATVTATANTIGEYFHTLTAVWSLKQNHFYILTIKQNTDVVFMDKVFCTNQSIPTFSVNTGQYTTNSSNNDFILYE